MNPFENIKHGAFTQQFQKRKQKHIKTLGEYAHFIKKIQKCSIISLREELIFILI